MKKLFGAYRQELMRVFSSYKIYICIISYILVCVYMSYNFDTNSLKKSVLERLVNIAGFNNMNKIPVLIASIPMATSFCDDISNNYFNSCIIRCGGRNYIISKFTTSYIISFLISFIGLSIYSVICGVKNGLGVHQVHEYRVFHDIAYGNYPVLAAISFIFLFSMVSAIYAVMGMALSSAVPNRFVAVTSTFFINMFVENVLDFLPKSISLFDIQKGNNAYLGMRASVVILLSCMVCMGYFLIALWVFKHFAERRLDGNESH